MPQWQNSRRFKQFLRAAQEERGDGSIGSIERAAGIRHREALWLRAQRIVGYDADSQVLVDCAMNRCRRLRALRQLRATRS